MFMQMASMWSHWSHLPNLMPANILKMEITKKEKTITIYWLERWLVHMSHLLCVCEVTACTTLTYITVSSLNQVLHYLKMTIITSPVKWRPFIIVPHICTHHNERSDMSVSIITWWWLFRYGTRSRSFTMYVRHVQYTIKKIVSTYNLLALRVVLAKIDKFSTRLK